MERLTQEVSDRFDQFNTQNDEVINKITDQMTSLADRFDARVEESEQRSANAIEQVGEQVANVAHRLQARQERAFNQLKESMDEARKQQSMRLSDALSGVSDRIEKMQQQQASAMSPVQKAIASLATRLEALEDFTTPPHASVARDEETEFSPPPFDEYEADAGPQPDLTFEDEPENEDQEDIFADEAAADVEPEPAAEELEESDDIFEIEIDDSSLEFGDDAEDEFEAGIPDASDIDETEIELSAEEDGSGETDISQDGDFTEDPLSELSGWDDGADEARDSDIFGDDDPVAGVIEDEAPEEELTAEAEPEADEPEEKSAGDVSLEEDAEAMDYLSRARKAAMAATAESGRTFSGKSRTRGKSRVPLVAAVSVVALATAAAGTFVTLRGLQEETGRPVVPPTDPIEAEATSAALSDAAPAIAEEAAAPDVEPVREEELAGLSDADAAAVETELFEEPAPVEPEMPAPVETAPQQIVNYAELPVIPATPTLESAASTGDPVAQLVLGEQRLDAGDYTSGPSLVRKAAEAGEPAAQYRLAKLHERGLGVPKDLEAARTWTERAAEGGNVKAMHDLAVYYAEGEGGQQSYAAAAEWFRKAADYGLTDSQYNLAVLYEAGLGISPSQTEALYWYEVAHAQGDQGAIDKVEELRARLSLDAAQQAQRRAASWTAATQDPKPNGEFNLQSWQGNAPAQVSAVQTILTAIGYEAGPADGIMGAGTSRAIANYQSDSGLQPTGTITRELVNDLNALVAGGGQRS
ncbi:MAG: peptidoglycan-binding protein [Pseudomonadota bacterium]|nr:peptidoglycan-binding protein [Pseudomonadota bacterium]